MAQDDALGPSDPKDQFDRKWAEMLQELRVMQTGTQLIAGFLLILPFQPAFADLDGFQRGLYLVLVVLAALVTILVLSPVAIHRYLTGRDIKQLLVTSAHRLVVTALGMVALLIAGIATLIFDVVVGRGSAVTVGIGFLVLAILLMAVVPAWLVRRDRVGT